MLHVTLRKTVTHNLNCTRTQLKQYALLLTVRILLLISVACNIYLEQLNVRSHKLRCTVIRNQYYKAKDRARSYDASAAACVQWTRLQGWRVHVGTGHRDRQRNSENIIASVTHSLRRHKNFVTCHAVKRTVPHRPRPPCATVNCQTFDSSLSPDLLLTDFSSLHEICQTESMNELLIQIKFVFTKIST